MMKHIITLSGDIGSGKSTIANALATKLLGLEIVKTGMIQRAIAAKRGMTTLELNKVSQTDRSVDDEIDSFVIDLGKNKDNLIIDSRLAWHFIPTSFKVFLSVDLGIGAERVYSASRADENNATLAATLENNLNRQSLEDVRFQKLYDINFRQYSNYDLVIDTSFATPEIIATKIYDCFQLWLSGQHFHKIWLNPKRLIPTQTLSENSDHDYEAIYQAISETGFDDLQPIDAFIARGFIYIWNGHKRVLASEKSEISFLPINLLTEELADEISTGLTAEKIADGVNLSAIHDWEDAIGYRYKIYPNTGTP